MFRPPPSDLVAKCWSHRAAILDKIKRTGDSVNSMSYWVFTDIFEEPGPRFTPFHGGFGLLVFLKNPWPKPNRKQ
jgi:xylan 1,4-beta-xylosidase